MHANFTILSYKSKFNCSYIIANSLLNKNEQNIIYGPETERKFIGEIKLKVLVEHPIDNSLGMATNHHQLKIIVDNITAKLNDKYLNKEIEEFHNEVPTLENIAKLIWKWLNGQEPQINGLKVIKLVDSDNFAVIYGSHSNGYDDVAGFII